VDGLNKKNNNSILNYTTVHKGGIAGTEKKKYVRKSTNTQNQSSKQSKKKGGKTSVSTKKTGVKNGQKKS